MTAKDDKPIVFLSHSGKDRDILLALKALLHKRASGAIRFFLSSDGESLQLGRNWVVELSDALDNAKLMFVFLSQNSVESRWVLFEAGHALGKGVKVVPVCLPDIEINQIEPPLSLLQGFTLHSHRSLSNLARLCNEEFGLDINEEFSEQDFEKIGGIAELENTPFLGQWTGLLSRVYFNGHVELEPGVAFDALGELRLLYQQSGDDDLEIVEKSTRDGFEVPGALVRQVKENANQKPGEPPKISHRLWIRYAPELLHVHAPVADRWFAGAKIKPPMVLQVQFNSEAVALESDNHVQRARLYKTGVKSVAEGWWALHGVKFRIADKSTIEINYTGALLSQPIRELFTVLFRRGVMTVGDAAGL